MLRFNQNIVHLSTIITLNDFILIISDISIDFSVFLLKRNFILSTCQVKYSCSYNFRMVSSFFKVSSSIWIWFNYKYKCNGFLVLRLFFLLNFQFFKTFKVIRINARMEVPFLNTFDILSCWKFILLIDLLFLSLSN